MEWINHMNPPTSSCSRAVPSTSASRMLASYEISDDLNRLHVQALERKYGGKLRAHSAATKIQRAFRLYRLHKQFRSVVTRESNLPSEFSPRSLETTECFYSKSNGFSLLKNSGTASQPVLKYQAANSLRAQLFVERSALSPRKNSTPLANDMPYNHHHSASAQKASSQRGFADLMSPRLSQRHAFGSPYESHVYSNSMSPSVWIPQRGKPTDFRSPSPSNRVADAPFATSDGHFNQTNSLSRLEIGRKYKSSQECRPGMPINGDLTQFQATRTTCSHNTTQSTTTSEGCTMRLSKDNDIYRRRLYRIALNFFNKKPDRGIQLLVEWGFVDENPKAIAKLFLSRRGLGKQMIGEFLGTLRSAFHSQILDEVLAQISMHNVEVDMALREMLHYFRLPTEAQKIDYVMQAFARRYKQCNAARLPPQITTDAIYILAFATIMLNTDLHSPSMKESKKMRVEEFVRNTWRASQSFEKESLIGIYDRVKENEIRSGSDHVSQVLKVDQSIVGKDKPLLVEQHRRLICYCRLNQIIDPAKKQSITAHQREIFLFNDIMLITKNVSKKKAPAQYVLKSWSPLIGVNIHEFDNANYTFGLKILFPGAQHLYFNAKNGDDRHKFMADVKESVAESTEMEQMRLKFELDKQREMDQRNVSRIHRTDSQRDSGLPDLDQGSPLMSRKSDSSFQTPGFSSTSSTEYSTPQRMTKTPTYSAFSNGTPQRTTHHQSPVTGPVAPNGRRLSFNSLDSGMVEESNEFSM
ncbi:unnamed protein product [Bursaphelenchus okinawaensis]|uniref:SEC7 domain-containing protein n=1 Tax=Bursaphelenchus okinawaensis TaxID=465554 RepID=A0A811KZN5_9BILA|nr:unnamed protein product [Bursaphelenchus okinawaensis]CAG9113554.1 unnamed protein product [Bursaphelenchus okinawaensis]